MPELPSDLNLYLVESLDDCMAMKRWLGERREGALGLDTETSGLNPYAINARLRMVQIGDKHTGWAVPWERWGGAAMECLNAWEGEITGHNLSFDVHWLEIHAGWKAPWHRIHDSMIMGQIERPHKSNKLKVISDEFIDPLASEGEKKLKAAFKKYGWFWDTVPINFPDYWFYSALDPVLAVHAASHFNYGKNYPEVYDMEMSVLRVVNAMERTGMRVDLNYSKKKFDEFTQRVEDAEKWAKDNWGISISSNQQLVEFMTKHLGAEFSIFTEKGAPSVNKDQLEEFIKSDDPMISQVASYVLGVRKTSKLNNAYFSNFLTMNTDGIVHPNIKTLGARTSRMSVTTPALQTIPRGDAVVRDAFIPSNEDELLLSCDYSQVEMRLLAHFSGDKKLQQAFKDADENNGDFFVTLGRNIYSDPEFSKEDSRRGLVKGTLYGSVYGSGIQKMADTAGITFAQMEPVANAVFETYPGIKGFMAEIERIGTRREKKEGEGYILTEMGRRLPSDKRKVYSLTNYMLQGTAAELMKKSILRLDAEGFTPFMRMPIHDEMIFSIPKGDIAEASPEIERIMSYTNGEFAVDLPAEPEAGMDRWGSKYRKEGEVFDVSAYA